MRDLFASLVDRALDRAPVVQRRQPTLFEPIAPTSLAEQSQPESRSPLEEKETVVESRPSRDAQKPFVNTSSRSPQPSLGEEAELRQPVAARRGPRLPDASQPVTDQETGPARPVADASRRDSVKMLIPEEPRREFKDPFVPEPHQLTHTPAQTIETIVERRVEREIIKEHSTDQPALKEVHSVDQPTGRSKPAREHDGAEEKQPLKAEVKQPRTAKEQTIVKPLIQQKPPPRRDSPPVSRVLSRAEAKHSSKQSLPPVIHVTIGRVEVRATPPAAGKPRAPQPVGPKMSLEDYLRSRGEGK